MGRHYYVKRSWYVGYGIHHMGIEIMWMEKVKRLVNGAYWHWTKGQEIRLLEYVRDR